MKLIKQILRIILGLFFIVSAYLKYLSIDEFEIYVYSFNILSLNLSFLLSRLLLSFELLIGIFLILGLLPKITLYSAVGSLAAFCLFIIYLLLSKNPEHCHCLGSMIKMSHPISLIKNIIIICLLIFSYSKENYKYKKLFKNITIPALIVVSLALPLILSPPDFFRFNEYKSTNTYNQELLNEFLEEENLEESSKIICFYSGNCKYCRLSAKKLRVISDKTDADNLFLFAFVDNDEESIDSFIKETNNEKIKDIRLDANSLLKITNGYLPLIIIIKKGEVVETFSYRDIDEKLIINSIEDIRVAENYIE